MLSNFLLMTLLIYLIERIKRFLIGRGIRTILFCSMRGSIIINKSKKSISSSTMLPVRVKEQYSCEKGLFSATFETDCNIDGISFPKFKGWCLLPKTLKKVQRSRRQCMKWNLTHPQVISTNSISTSFWVGYISGSPSTYCIF